MPAQKKRPSPFEGQAIGENARDASLRLKGIPELAGRVVGRTNLGAGRVKNQDAASAYVLRDKKPPLIALSVADGLGCYLHSERSAYAAVTRIPALLSGGEDLPAAFKKFHAGLLSGSPYASSGKRSRVPSSEEPPANNPEDQGSTTCVMALISGDELQVANVGDSRACLIRDGKIAYKTRDQSLMELIFSEFPEQRATTDVSRHPWRSVLLNSLGSPEPTFQFEENGQKVVKESGSPKIDSVELRKGDFVFLATDGAFNNLDEQELIRLVEKTNWEKLEATLDALIQKTLKKKVNAKGGLVTMDNYTFVIYRHLPA